MRGGVMGGDVMEGGCNWRGRNGRGRNGNSAASQPQICAKTAQKPLDSP